MDKKLAIDSAKKYYSEIPYHNFEHALHVAKKSEEIAEQCEKEGISISKKVIFYAALFHDAGYAEKSEFQSKEEYSAYLAGKALETLGVDKETIIKVKQAIIATHQLATFGTPEEKIVRTADLSGLAASYEEFIELKKRI